MGNYRRPDWFIQGPRDMVLQYLACAASTIQGARHCGARSSRPNLRAYTENVMNSARMQRLLRSRCTFRQIGCQAHCSASQPSGGPAALIAAPVVDEEWRNAVLRVLFPLDQISDLLRPGTGRLRHDPGLHRRGDVPRFPAPAEFHRI